MDIITKVGMTANVASIPSAILILKENKQIKIKNKK